MKIRNGQNNYSNYPSFQAKLALMSKEKGVNFFTKYLRETPENVEKFLKAIRTNRKREPEMYVSGWSTYDDIGRAIDEDGNYYLGISLTRDGNSCPANIDYNKIPTIQQLIKDIKNRERGLIQQGKKEDREFKWVYAPGFRRNLRKFFLGI